MVFLVWYHTPWYYSGHAVWYAMVFLVWYHTPWYYSGHAAWYHAVWYAVVLGMPWYYSGHAKVCSVVCHGIIVWYYGVVCHCITQCGMPWYYTVWLAMTLAMTLVTSYILSWLDYCNCLLMGTPNSVIQPLHKIHNFAARLVLLAPRHHHATPLLEKLLWLPISACIKYKVACMCFSAINGSGPAYLSELLHVYTLSCTLCSSSDTCMLEIQQYKCKTHGFRTFSCFGPHIWNSLPQDLRHCSTLSSFKAKLKTFLFSQYFHPN